MNTVLALIIMMANNTLKDDISTTFSRYLIANLGRIEKMTMRDISNECFISTSSIINYTKVLGFGSYSEFKHQLFDNIKIRKMQMTFRYGKLSSGELLRRIGSFAPADYDLEELDQQLDQVARLLQTNQSLTIIGASFPVALSYSLQEDLAVLGKPVWVQQPTYNDGVHEFQPDSLLLLITITGRFVQISANFYHQILESGNDLAIISQDTFAQDGTNTLVSMPFIGDTEYNDVVLLLLFDLIKLKYYRLGPTSLR